MILLRLAHERYTLVQWKDHLQHLECHGRSFPSKKHENICDLLSISWMGISMFHLQSYAVSNAFWNFWQINHLSAIC